MRGHTCLNGPTRSHLDSASSPPSAQPLPSLAITGSQTPSTYVIRTPGRGLRAGAAGAAPLRVVICGRCNADTSRTGRTPPTQRCRYPHGSRARARRQTRWKHAPKSQRNEMPALYRTRRIAEKKRPRTAALTPTQEATCRRGVHQESECLEEHSSRRCRKKLSMMERWLPAHAEPFVGNSS